MPRTRQSEYEASEASEDSRASWKPNTFNWQHILRVAFPDKPVGEILRYIGGENLSMAQYAARLWHTKPGVWLRRSHLRGRGAVRNPSHFERTRRHNRIIETLLERFPIEMFEETPWPDWMLLQLYHYICLMNGLWKLVHSNRMKEVQTRNPGDVDMNLFAASVTDLMDILSAPQGIEYMRNRPLPIGGPGADPGEVRSLINHYLKRHSFPVTQMYGRCRRLHHRVEQVADHYVDMLTKYRPSIFLSITSNSYYTRYSQLDAMQEPDDGAPMQRIADEGRFDFIRATTKPFEGVLKQDMWERLERMVETVRDMRPQSGDVKDWDSLLAIIRRGGQADQGYKLPLAYARKHDFIVEAILRNGGCPDVIHTGCSSGLLRGTGWVSLPNLIHCFSDVHFWNETTDQWEWLEEGDGVLEPLWATGNTTEGVKDINPDEVNAGTPRPLSPGAVTVSSSDDDPHASTEASSDSDSQGRCESDKAMTTVETDMSRPIVLTHRFAPPKP